MNDDEDEDVSIMPKFTFPEFSQRTSRGRQYVAICKLEERMNIDKCINIDDVNKENSYSLVLTNKDINLKALFFLQDGISKTLLSQFYLSSTIEGAASQLGVGVTALKKRCRQLGIKRWPHRQVNMRFDPC